MFHTKVTVGTSEIYIKPPVPPISFSLSLCFGVFFGFLVHRSLHGGVFFADIATAMLFCCLWIASYFLALSFTYKKRRDDFVIYASGVACVSKKGKVTFSLTWDEIHDFGFSYGGGLGISQYYSLYFSDSVCTRSKREKVKKYAKGRCAFITFDERSYMLNGGEILAFCKQFTDVKPFTADPRNH